MNYDQIEFTDQLIPYLEGYETVRLTDTVENKSCRDVFAIGECVVKVEPNYANGLDQCNNEMELWNDIDESDKHLFAEFYGGGPIESETGRSLGNYTIMEHISGSERTDKFDKTIFYNLLEKYNLSTDICEDEYENQFFYDSETGFKITDYGVVSRTY